MREQREMQTMLDQLESFIKEQDEQIKTLHKQIDHLVAEARLAKPEQEPVAVWELTEDGWDTIADAAWMETLPVGTKLYTAPPRKEWVGLTDEEIKGILDCGRGNLIDIKKAEQTLKDKNT
jgi:hypothetical protein